MEDTTKILVVEDDTGLREALAYNLSHEGYTVLSATNGLQAIDVARRNVITQGVDLNALIGVEFEIQGTRFAGVEECRPCHWMNHAFQDERVEQWLQGRGGLRARILTDGVLTCGVRTAVRRGAQGRHASLFLASR